MRNYFLFCSIAMPSKNQILLSCPRCGYTGSPKDQGHRNRDVNNHIKNILKNKLCKPVVSALNREQIANRFQLDVPFQIKPLILLKGSSNAELEQYIKLLEQALETAKETLISKNKAIKKIPIEYKNGLFRINADIRC